MNFELLMTQLGLLFLYAGVNERVVELLTGQLKVWLNIKFNSGTTQLLATLTGVGICFMGGIGLIPYDILKELGLNINNIMNTIMAGVVVGLGSGPIHDLMGFLRALKDILKDLNVSPTKNENSRENAF